MNAYSVVEQFEKRVAEFSGARFGVAVESCTAALFLSLKYRDVKGYNVTIPARTYVSVPMQVIHAGGIPVFKDIEWKGIYELAPFDIWDGAKRFCAGMYKGGLHCLSFHVRKHVAIGRGGMILTDDIEAVKWLKRARYDGREGKPYPQENITQVGWNMYMTPEQAARGLMLMDVTLPNYPDQEEVYPDLREMPVFKCASA